MKYLIPFTDEQEKQLNALVAEIKSYDPHVFKWALLMRELKESNLWRAKYTSWTAFCSWEFGYTKQRTSTLLKAAENVCGLKLIAETTGEAVDMPKSIREAARESAPRRTQKSSNNNGEAKLIEAEVVLEPEPEPEKVKNPPDLPMDWRILLDRICKHANKLVHRSDLSVELLKEVAVLNSELSKLRDLVQPMLPGMERHAVKVMKRPSIDEVKEYFQTKEVGLPQSDAVWFWNHLETQDWKINGKPMKSWHTAVTAWKIQKYFPSMKGQNNGHTNGVPMPLQRTIRQQNVAAVCAEAERICNRRMPL